MLLRAHSCGHEAKEVAENPQTDICRFFRMKLYACHAISLDRGGELDTVMGRANTVSGHRRRERVRKVDLITLIEPIQEP